MADIKSIRTPLQTPLARARGMGSAHTGAHHWWVQRMTALALIPLCTWLVVSIALLSSQPYSLVRAWMTSPVTAVLLLLSIGNLFYHAWLGLQVVIEDYISKKSSRVVILISLQGVVVLTGALAAFAIIKIALG
jgi:succinate dehydrogenase / fumarate reductase membrane anchor subunit